MEFGCKINMDVNVYPTFGVNYIQIKNARTSADSFTLNVPGERHILLGFRGVNNYAVSHARRYMAVGYILRFVCKICNGLPKLRVNCL